MPIVAQGGSLTLDAQFYGVGGLQDASGAGLTIKNGAGADIAGFPVGLPPIVRDGTGIYHYGWSVPVGLAVGTYHANWSGTVSGASVSGTEAIDVVAAGSIVTPSLDATVAGDNANSYLSLAAADGFAATDVGPERDAWIVANSDLRTRALERATREIDAYLRSSGVARYSATQALLYPRAVDTSGSTPIIPTAIKRATWAQAKFLLVNAAVLDSAQSRRARGIDSGSEPNVSWTNSRGTSGEPFLCDEALGYLQGIFAKAATVRSVVIGTDYTYPVLGDPGLDVLP